MSTRTNSEAQRQLGEFLRARRWQIVRADLGLPLVGRRDIGLRREEVAVLSGMSVTWYTWLEQGRDTRPSRQVLDAIAGTLRLSVAEHAYVLSLAGYAADRPAEARIPGTAPARVLRLLDLLAGLPAYVIAPDRQILGWTSTFAALYPTVATVDEVDRNQLWLMFTDPGVREMCPDWEVISRSCLAEFRADAGRCLAEPPCAHVIGRLLEASPAFRATWARHDVAGCRSPERVIRHAVGELRLERHRLVFSDPPDLRIVIHTPVQYTETAARLRRLVGDADGACSTWSG
jgi:transcriptional regulator with XRE-family HTH domain